MVGSLGSRSGGIQVRTTERGLPIALKLDKRELSKSPTQLAQEILTLCQLSAKRMQVERRRALLAAGVSPGIVRGLNLSSPEELARAEAESSDSPDDLPDSWMRPI
ncbi:MULTISPECIES: hypothetical protein [unclassified Mycobacterium]|uniref:hypothetical protein n=1 Tax=unclassified Mycobacterium TaxID=2642494 RepID=UPI0008023C6A|nr:MULTISPECIES: hypothetical protein [unclassified Mycobacterium]OBG78659.1 hypothetical protein A5700_15945 [Mycobacterium sp. E1214]OBH24024.1 hypothetical protein A5693_08875 [Mycobacterium sp. E1319]